MKKEKILPILKGIFISLFPLQKFTTPVTTGGTIDSRYCYSVWLRHLVKANNNGITGIPATVAELGPGDSIGLGLAALLSGTEKYYALDIFQYWNAGRNLRVFDELVQLFKNKTPIPEEEEFKPVSPKLEDYSFPSVILTDAVLENSLAEERIKKIRDELAAPENKNGQQFIFCFTPWADKAIIKNETVNLIISQSVLEYLPDLDAGYTIMNQWLKPGGIMSHSIDLSSLGLTKEWNGHWTYTNLQWKLYRGKRKMYINRAPLSQHLSLLKKNRLMIIEQLLYTKENNISVNELAGPWRRLSKEDLCCKSFFIQCKKNY